MKFISSGIIPSEMTMETCVRFGPADTMNPDNHQLNYLINCCLKGKQRQQQHQ